MGFSHATVSQNGIATVIVFVIEICFRESVDDAATRHPYKLEHESNDPCKYDDHEAESDDCGKLIVHFVLLRIPPTTC